MSFYGLASFPRCFAETIFFDLSEHRLAGQRALKRWLLRQDPFFETASELPERSASAGPANQALDDLERRIADQPGVQADVEKELALAFEFCAARRLLFVFEHVAPSDKELVAFGGKTSGIFIIEQSSQPQCSLEETAALFSRWRTNFDASLSALGNAQNHLGKLPEYSGERWQIAISLGSAAFSPSWFPSARELPAKHPVRIPSAQAATSDGGH